MKITVTLSNLREAVRVASVALSARISLPVLEQIRVRARGGVLRLTATNLDAWASCDVPADVGEEGGVLLHGATLSSLIARFPDGPVTLAVGNHGIAIKAGSVKARLATMELFEFPRVAERKTERAWKMTGVQLAQIAHRVAFAATEREPQGVNWTLKDGRMTAVATDHHTLALQRFGCNGTEAQALLQPESLAGAVRVVGDYDEIEVAHSGDWLTFTAGGRSYAARLMSASYPDVERFIPTESEVRATVDRAALLNALTLASVVAHDLTGMVALAFDTLTLNVSAGSDKGDGASDLPAVIEGGPITVYASAGKLIAGLKRLPTETVRFDMTMPHKQIVMRPVGGALEGEEQLVIVMPFNPPPLSTNSETKARGSHE